MKMPGLTLALLAALAGTAGAQPAAPAATRTTLVKAARIVDVEAGRYLAGHAILIENDRIKEVGPWAAVQGRAPADVVVIDLGEATVLPGLIDCHAHLLSSMRARRTTRPPVTLSASKTCSGRPRSKVK